jgi:N-acetylglutamate synthase-like GNAT family acetyltransferase
MSGREAYSVRVADPRDNKSVSDLLSASYPVLLAPDYDPRLLSAALPLIINANTRMLASGTYYVAVTGGGAIVGCGGWTAEAPGGGESKPGIGHVRHFAVHPDWTRRGVGSALLNICIEEAQFRGVGTLECFSTLTAESFYRSAGFVVVDAIAMQLSPAVALPGVLLRRSLA